jgi:hypothetical protein
VPPPTPTRDRRVLLVDAWVVLLVVVLVWPLLSTGGHPLARDLVFTPSQPFRLAWLGLGDSPARAVPLDALVSLGDVLMDGAVLARIAIVGILVIAGCAAHRLLRGAHPVARAAAAGFAVWNPFVVERLSLGQWALLAAYAAGFVIIGAASRLREIALTGTAAGEQVTRLGPAAYAPVLLALALAAITPTGALIGGLLAVVVGWTRRTAAGLLGAATLVQLPWLLPSLLDGAGRTSDPDGVLAFASRAERAGGALWSLLGLGGIWDAGSVPASRAGPLGHLGVVIVVAALVSGWPVLRRLAGVATAHRLAVVAVLGLLAATLASLPGGDAVARWLVGHVPGAGLLRDGQKWLLPFALLAVLCLGAAAQRLVAVLGRTRPALLATAAVVAIGLPVVALPDAAAATWPTVRPVVYPTDYARVAALVDGTDGDLVTLPWQPYRVFPWGNPVAVYDPASRWFDTDVVMSDRLRVGATELAGESPRAAAIREVVGRAGPALAGELARLDVRWLLVQTDARTPVEVPSGVVARYAGDHLGLYEVPGPRSAGDPAAAPLVTAIVVLTDALVALVVTVAGVLATRGRRAARRRLPAGMLRRTQRGS